MIVQLFHYDFHILILVNLLKGMNAQTWNTIVIMCTLLTILRRTLDLHTNLL